MSAATPGDFQRNVLEHVFLDSGCWSSCFYAAYLRPRQCADCLAMVPAQIRAADGFADFGTWKG